MNDHATVLAFDWGAFLTDNALWLMIVLILLTAVVGTFIRERKKDKCLKFFNRFTVTMVRQGNKLAWGRLKVFSKGLELVFRKPHADEGRIKTSFLIYESEQAQLISIFRYHDQLGPKNRQRRLKQIRKQFRPGIFRRNWRRLRNIFNTLRDALNKAIGVAIGQAAKMNPQSQVLSRGQSQVSEMSGLALEQVANAYEPILEQHIGRPVIVEVADPVDPKRHVEYEGFLADYTINFVCVMNVRAKCREELPAAAVRSTAFEGRVVATRSGDTVRLTSELDEVVRVTLPDGGERRLTSAGPLEVQIAPPAEGDAPGHIAVEIARGFDVVAPRKTSTVRHASGATLADPVETARAAADEQADPEAAAAEQKEEEALNES